MSRRIDNRRSPRKGLTLPEVLVSIGVLSVLILIALPAVQEARESARRSSCANNLRQFGFGINLYIAKRGILPPGHSKGSYSLHTTILNYMDQTAIHNSINFSTEGAMNPLLDNATTASVNLSAFLCPSSQRGQDNGLGWTSYAGNRGAGYQTYGYNGLFATAFDPPILPSSVRDGFSQTAAMSEWIVAAKIPPDRDVKSSVFQTPNMLLQPNELDVFAGECNGVNPDRMSLSPILKGNNWLYGEFGRTLYNHTMLVNDRSCTNGAAVQHGAWTAGSMHDRGAYTLFLDGHTQFVKNSVTLKVWRAISSRNGSEILSSDSF